MITVYKIILENGYIEFLNHDEAIQYRDKNHKNSEIEVIKRENITNPIEV
jgi:hypothetical protein